MTYGSVCSGIEAATVAWEPLGFHPAWFAEIDPFCSALLAHHYPEVKNLGDFTQIGGGFGAIDILVGGTPCQSFSVAGRRGGLDDARGNLAIEFCRLAGRLWPRWIVWENVPGVLSANAGRDFGTILGALAKLGYGCAWRVLDAQFFGVPQRRRRVFVVGHLGDWRPAAAVLLERESLCRDTPARRKARQVVAALTTHGVGTCGADDNRARAGHLIPLAFSVKDYGADLGTISPTLRAMSHDRSHANAGGQVAVCVQNNQTGSWEYETAGTVRSDALGSQAPGSLIWHRMAALRRLTPRECERLQGFPDDYTLIPNYRKKLRADEIEEMAAYLGIPYEEAMRLGATPDGPRYRAIGNSMAVPVMRWIGRRIQLVDGLVG